MKASSTLRLRRKNRELMTLLHLQCQPKRGIYVHVQSCYFYMSHLINLFLKVRFSGKEYALMQPIDSFMDSSAVKSVLQAEYALLCICNILKHEFDKHAHESSVNTLSGGHS